MFLDFLFHNTWPWWAAGIGLGLTAVGLAWVTGRRLGISSGFSDACSWVSGGESFSWKMLFLLGLPLGAFLATAKGWNWTLLYGRLDALTSGSFALKAILLFIAGSFIGFGARWAGGCTSGHSIMGVSLGNKMSIAATVVFILAGALFARLLLRGM